MQVIGRKCVVRSTHAGVFFGTVTSFEGDQVEMSNARRLWYWSGAASLSQLAVEGVKNPDQCKFPVAVPAQLVTGVIEIIPASDAAIASLEGVRVWQA
ncbi:MAG: DUF6948 domain-containing protein [Acidiferrobacteraceae bacterium]